MTQWMDRSAALKALGIKAQTLYAYVSRGRIGMMPDPADSRRSLYRADDVAALAGRRARGRKLAAIAESTIAWGEPSIVTSISTVRHGKLIYRDRDAIALAGQATLEDAATLLWQAEDRVRFASPAIPAPDPYRTLAALIPASRPALGRGVARLHRDAERAIGHLAIAVGAAPGDEPVHVRLARAWSLDDGHADRVRRALVLVADHELNASAFAARVAASTGASLAACLLAGLATLSGPRHGGAGAALIALIEEAARIGAEAAVAGWLARGLKVPGFGHPLYPEGDPRAQMLIGDVAIDACSVQLRQAVFDMTGALPNIDFALAAFTRAAGLPPDAPLSLFMLGRSVGWAAHAIEQIERGDLIRPRARYQPDGIGE